MVIASTDSYVLMRSTYIRSGRRECTLIEMKVMSMPVLAIIVLVMSLIVVMAYLAVVEKSLYLVIYLF